MRFKQVTKALISPANAKQCTRGVQFVHATIPEVTTSEVTPEFELAELLLCLACNAQRIANVLQDR